MIKVDQETAWVVYDNIFVPKRQIKGNRGYVMPEFEWSPDFMDPSRGHWTLEDIFETVDGTDVDIFFTPSSDHTYYYSAAVALRCYNGTGTEEEPYRFELIYIDKVHVTFDPDNGEGSFTVPVVPGEKVEKPENPVNDPWYFCFWYADPVDIKADPYKFDADVNEDLSLKAVWGGVFTVSVNDMDMGSVADAKKGETPGDFYSYSEILFIRDYADEYTLFAQLEEGCSFVKWVDQDGELVSEKAQIDYKFDNGKQLIAVFERDFEPEPDPQPTPTPAPTEPVFAIPKTGVETDHSSMMIRCFALLGVCAAVLVLGKKR